jgi:hypothetical protein
MARLRKVFVFAVVVSLLAFWTAQARAADVIRGHIATVSTEEFEFTMTDVTGKEWRFQLGDGAVIRTCDRATVEELLAPDGNIRWTAVLQMFLGMKPVAPRPQLQLGELRKSDVVAVTYMELGKQLIALEVCVKRD